MADYSLFRRKNSLIYYAQIKNPETGQYLPAKSTGEEKKTAALIVVSRWIENGIPDKKTPKRDIFNINTLFTKLRETELTEDDAERIIEILKRKQLIQSAIINRGTIQADDFTRREFIPFLYEFWDYDNSIYIQDKLEHNHGFSRNHAKDQWNRVKYWKSHFKNIQIQNITREKIKEFGRYLIKKNAPNTVNKIMTAGLTALSWLHREGHISINPGAGLGKYNGNVQNRSILTPQEVEKLFSVKWNNELSRTANLLACTAGLRAGEIRGLRREDIKDTYIKVEHSYNNRDGLKETKNKENRKVPILPVVRDELLRLADSNPHKSENGYIFYSENPQQPCDGKLFRYGLEQALLKMSLSDQDRKDPEKRKETAQYWKKERGICFHSWRHYFSTHIASKLPISIAQKAIGHRTQAMTEWYSRHENDENMIRITEAVKGAFSAIENVIPFPAGKEVTG